jgi:hypothetical protein
MKRLLLFLGLCLACLLLVELRTPAPLEEGAGFSGPAAEEGRDKPEGAVERVAPRKPRPVPKVRELARWISQDVYCADANQGFLRDEGTARSDGKYILIYRALELANGERRTDPCVAALLARTRGSVVRLSSRGTGTACRLIRGLALSGQWMSSRESPEPGAAERAEGARILQEHAAEHRENGYFALAQLGALEEGDRRGREEAYLDFLRATEFENPLLPALAELKRLGHANSTALLYSVEVLSSAGTPDFGSASRAARALAKEGLFPEEFRAFTERLAGHFARNDERRLSWPVASILEDAVQRGIALAGAPVVGRLPSSLGQKSWLRYFRARTLPQDLTAMADFNGPCTPMLESVRRAQPEIVREDERQLRDALARAW